MNELKDIFTLVLKAPNLIPLLVTFLVVNQKWLFPQIPDEVVQAFLNLLQVILVAIVSYYVGANVNDQHTRRELARRLIAQQLAAQEEEK